MKRQIANQAEMLALGAELAQKLPINFCLELVGDIGVGKTTLVKGLIKQLNSDLVATSPSFMINNRYQVDDQRIVSHFDFYRLSEVGLDDQQLIEDLADDKVGVIIEWSQTVAQLLPENRLIVEIEYQSDQARLVTIKGLDEDDSRH